MPNRGFGAVLSRLCLAVSLYGTVFFQTMVRQDSGVPSWMQGLPFWALYAAFFCGAFMRGQATYWAGRGAAYAAHRPAEHGLRARYQDKAHCWATPEAQRALQRFGLPLVSLAYLTVGLQTVILASAGLLRFSWKAFTAAQLLGCAAWAGIYATIGFAAWEALLGATLTGPLLWGVLLAIAAVVGAATFALYRHTKKAPTSRKMTES